MADAVPGKTRRSYVWGPLSAFGLGVAVLACIADQASKYALLYGADLADRGQIALGPFISLDLTWNPGISYGLLPQQSLGGQLALLAFKAAAVVFLWAWLARAPTRLTAVALSLIIGGAVGNALDRLHWPGVMDFVLLHIDTATWRLNWYVFNLADVAIVAGVVGLLYESLRGAGAVKAP